MQALLTNAPADPATLFAEECDDIFNEAKNFLDGEPIANEAQAEAVSALLNRARRIAKDADEARKREAKPFDEGKAAVHAKWKPVTGKAELVAETCKKALAPWLEAIEAKQREEAEKAAAEALRLTQIALEAHKSSAGNLEAAEDADRLMKAAKAASVDAAKADKARPIAKGGERGIGLVDVWTPTLTDPILAARHYFAKQPQAFEEWLLDQARKDVRSGVRTIPGFEITSERKAR